MLVLPDAWTWDFWLVDDGSEFHVFFLRASRALLDPDRRHHRAAIGHAVSRDLEQWVLLPDALVHDDPPAFDDLATWTGSVVADPAGGWRMLYTGVSLAERGTVQRIGAARSDDLISWHRDGVALEADARWYERASVHDDEQAWRDPWVQPDPGGAGWRMLVTACVPHPNRFERGVIGCATSADLRAWSVQAPLSRPGSGFGHLEVMQVEEVDGRAVLVFSCLATDLSEERRRAGQRGGVWALALDSTAGPFDVGAAQPLTGPERSAGRLIRDREGRWVLLAFRNASGPAFPGGLLDPVPVRWVKRPGGRHVLVAEPP